MLAWEDMLLDQIPEVKAMAQRLHEHEMQIEGEYDQTLRLQHA